MAIHHTRRKKAIALIGDEKDQGKIISLLKENEFTDEEVREILAGNPKLADDAASNEFEENPPQKYFIGDTQIPAPTINAAPAKESKYTDFDEFMGKAITRQYMHISGEMRNYISHFQLSEKVKTVRIEPALAKDFNRFAIGYIDNPGKMYFPNGEKQVGDIQPYNDPTYKPMNETSVSNEFMD